MKLRIACSILAAMGAAAFTQAPASAQELLKDPGEAYEFGELVVEPTPARSLLSVDDPVSRATCPEASACFWKQTDYGGDRKTVGASWAQQDRYLSTYDRSAKNRFGSRKLTIKDIHSTVVGCIDAGGTDNNLPASADIFRIGQMDSSC